MATKTKPAAKQPAAKKPAKKPAKKAEFTRASAEKLGWVFNTGLLDAGDNRPDVRNVAASKRYGNDLLRKEHPTEEQLLADIKEWEAAEKARLKAAKEG